MPSQREYKNFPKQIWNFYFSSFADCKKIYRYNISLFSCSRFSHRINKSYFYRFTAINFAKPYWRTGSSMIPFIPNPDWKSGGSHRDNHHFQQMIAQKERTAPQHTRSILPPIHPTKSIAALRGRYFSLWETYLENFISRPDVIPTFRQRRCKTGAGTSFGANGDPHTWVAQPLLIFTP